VNTYGNTFFAIFNFNFSFLIIFSRADSPMRFPACRVNADRHLFDQHGSANQWACQLPASIPWRNSNEMTGYILRSSLWQRVSYPGPVSVELCWMSGQPGFVRPEALQCLKSSAQKFEPRAWTGKNFAHKRRPRCLLWCSLIHRTRPRTSKYKLINQLNLLDPRSTHVFTLFTYLIHTYIITGLPKATRRKKRKLENLRPI
jgi:hypothetical protein